MLGLFLAAVGVVAGSSEKGGGACSSAIGCQLNGHCVGGACQCAVAWTGPTCAVLDVLPAAHNAGLYNATSDRSSWGNSVRWDPGSGRWWMAADEMAEHCGLQTWGTNSRCVMATAERPEGPYTVNYTVLDPWCHGSVLERDPISGRWLHGHMGGGSSGDAAVTPPYQPYNKPGCVSCSSGVTPDASCGKNATYRVCPHTEVPVEWRNCSGPNNTNCSRCLPGSHCSGQAGALLPPKYLYYGSGSALIAPSPQGPWESANNLTFGMAANCQPFFLRNGTLFMNCGGTVKDPQFTPAKKARGCIEDLEAVSALSRAETLEHALRGEWTFQSRDPILRFVDPSVANTTCVRWEGQYLWVDERGNFHMMAHAFCGGVTDYPLPGVSVGINGSVVCNDAPAGFLGCNAYGGHAFSEDGHTWYISPITPFTNEISFADGSVMAVRARERVHLIFNDSTGAPIFLCNGVGNPGLGLNTGVPGADHTFVQCVPLRTLGQ